jgi:hypothetical protein
MGELSNAESSVLENAARFPNTTQTLPYYFKLRRRKCKAFFAANLTFFHRQPRRTFTPAPGAPLTAALPRQSRGAGELRSPPGAA